MKTEEGVELTEKTIKKLWSIGRIICAILAAVSIIVTAWLVITMISNPFFGPRVMHLLLMMASSAIFINTSITIPQNYLINPKGLRLFVGAGKWALTIAFPFFLMASVNSFADSKTLEITRAELSPVIDFIDKNFNQHGNFPADILAEVEKIHKLTNVTYIFNDDNFLIQTRGSSIDIDGSTIFYLSSDREWRREHNDMIEAVATEDAKLYREATKWNTKRVYQMNYETNQWVASKD